jgi:hypothetical protein
MGARRNGGFSFNKGSSFFGKTMSVRLLSCYPVCSYLYRIGPTRSWNGLQKIGIMKAKEETKDVADNGLHRIFRMAEEEYGSGTVYCGGLPVCAGAAGGRAEKVP